VRTATPHPEGFYYFRRPKLNNPKEPPVVFFFLHHDDEKELAVALVASLTPRLQDHLERQIKASSAYRRRAAAGRTSCVFVEPGHTVEDGKFRVLKSERTSKEEASFLLQQLEYVGSPVCRKPQSPSYQRPQLNQAPSPSGHDYQLC